MCSVCSLENRRRTSGDAEEEGGPSERERRTEEKTRTEHCPKKRKTRPEQVSRSAALVVMKSWM